MFVRGVGGGHDGLAHFVLRVYIGCKARILNCADMFSRSVLCQVTLNLFTFDMGLNYNNGVSHWIFVTLRQIASGNHTSWSESLQLH
mgnify:CR=1 FL=1